MHAFSDDLDVADAQFEPPTEARPTSANRSGRDGVKLPPRQVFGEGDSLPFGSARRASPMAPHEGQITRRVMTSEKQGESHFKLSNFSHTPINYPDPKTALDKEYPTPEHLFQAMRYIGYKPVIAEQIRTCGENSKPRERVRMFVYEENPTWSTTGLYRMYEVLQLKFKAYPGLATELLDTGEAELVLDSSDPYWGRGADDRGRNYFGSLLMRLREELVENRSAQAD